MAADVSTSPAWIDEDEMQCGYFGDEDGLFGALVKGESWPQAATAYGIRKRGFPESSKVVFVSAEQIAEPETLAWQRKRHLLRPYQGTEKWDSAFQNRLELLKWLEVAVKCSLILKEVGLEGVKE
jgi:hypothetical protein